MNNKLIKGATSVEYGLIAALISIASIVALGVLGEAVYNMFSDTSEHLQVNGSEEVAATAPTGNVDLSTLQFQDVFGSAHIPRVSQRFHTFSQKGGQEFLRCWFSLS